MADQRAIACPYCFAPAGQRCYGTLDEDHFTRHKAALAASNEEDTVDA